MLITRWGFFSPADKGGTGGVYERGNYNGGRGCVAAEDEVIIAEKRERLKG